MGGIDTGSPVSALKPDPPSNNNCNAPFIPLDEYVPDELHQVINPQCYAITRAMAKDNPTIESEAIVSKPYIKQVSEQVVGTSSLDSPSSLGALKDVSISFPLNKVLSSYPEFIKAMEEFFSSLNRLNAFSVTSSSLLTNDCTYIDIQVNKIKIQAIVDSRAPCNIILSRLVKKLGLQPDIDHKQNYGTAGTETI